MSLELLNTLGTLTTVIIVGATAIAALVQLRHLRAANQINAMLSVVTALDAKAVRDAAEHARRELGSAINDPTFREIVVARVRGKSPPDSKGSSAGRRAIGSKRSSSRYFLGRL
jgi:hypothetical protein